MNTRRGTSGSMSPNKLKRSLSVSKGATQSQPAGRTLGAEVTRSLANNTAAAPSVLEPGTLRLFVSHGENLESLSHETGPGVWRLSISVDVLGLQQQLDQVPAPPPSRLKDPSNSMQLTRAVAAPRVNWDKSLSVPVHWSPTQSRVPVLHCQLSHSSDPSAPLAFATLDLAALLLRPLQLVYACLPLLTSTDVEPDQLSSNMDGPCLFVRCLYACASSAPSRVTAMAERLASPLPPPGPMPVGAPAGRLQVQLYSVTKLRRGCSGVANPQVWLCLQVPGQACPPLVRLDGSLSPFGEYAIYFDEAAEASLAVGSGCGAHPLLHVVLTGQGEGESQGLEVGRVTVPLFDALGKEGHVIDACYPLRAPGSCLKVADVRLALQFVPTSLGYTQTSASQAQGQEGGAARVLQVRVGALRGLYCHDFPGRKDPFVELGLILPAAPSVEAGEGEDEGSMPEGSHTGAEECDFVCCHVRSSVCTAGFEHLVWDEVLELPLPPDMSHEGATLVVKLKSAATLAPDRLLGSTHVPWPMDAGSERGWFTLSHPRAPEESVGEVSLAFLGLADGGEGAGVGPWMDEGHNKDLTSLFSSLPLSPSRGVPSGGITTALVMSPTRGGVREAWTATHASMGHSPMRTATQRGPHLTPASPTRVPRVLPATRCAQLHPCGPGLLLVTVSCLHCVTRHGASANIEAFRATTLLVKVRPRQTGEEQYDTVRELQMEDEDAGGDEGMLEGFGVRAGDTGAHSAPLPQLQGRLYPEVPAWPSLGGSAAVGPQETQPPRAITTVFVAPLAYGEESQIRLYVGRGRDGRHRRWYRGTLDPRPALALPGREVQAWKLLTPVGASPADAPPHSPAATCEVHEGQRMGRAHVQLRYLPHTVGTAVVGLQRASLSLGPEAALSADPSVSFVLNSLFVRLRVVPGGDWSMSTAKDVIFPASRGRGEQSISWGDEQVCVGVDTSTLPLLKPLAYQHGPCLELALLNDRAVVENVLGLATFPLAHLLTLPAPNASQASEPFTLPLRHPLTDAVVGQITTTLAFRHLYTPAAALDSSTHPSSETRQNNATLTDSQGGQDNEGRSVARAIRDLKRLFYSLDRSGDGFVSQDELLGYLTKPVATHGPGGEGQRQQQDLRDLMNVVLQGRGSGDLDVGEATREIFRSVDVNGDGQISWEEWASFLDMLLLSPHASCLLDVGLLRRNAEAMRTAALPLPPAAAHQDEAPPPLPIAVKRPHLGTPLPASDAPLPVITQTTALLRLDDLSLKTGPASPNPHRRKLNSTKGPAASPARGPGRGDEMSVVGSTRGGGTKASGVRSREELEEENTRLRLKLQAVEADARRRDAENRRGLEAEKAKFRKELGYLANAASDVLGVKNGTGRGALALTPVGFAPDPGVSAATPAPAEEASGGEEELLHLRALVTALRGGNDELRSALGSAKGEVANCLMQLDLAKSELSEASRHGLHEEAVKLELRRLDAARRHAEGARLLELRGVMSELSVAKQELIAYGVEVGMHQESAERSRKEVEQLRQALEREQKQCAHYQAEAQRCRAALLVYEHDHMRNRALIRLREQSLSDAATRHRLRSDASLAELRAQHVAALRIQSGMRGHAARSQVARQKDALLTIQSCARALLATRRVKNLRALREASAMRIQSRYRGHVAKQEVSKQKHSAAVIQAGVRGARDRQRNNDWMLQARKERHENALLIQATFRAARQKRMYKGLKRAVQVIQAKLKKFHLRKQRVYRRTAARRIIRALASWLGRRHQSAAVLQRAFKQHATTNKQEQAKAEKKRVQLPPESSSDSEPGSLAARTSALSTTAGAGFGPVDGSLAASVPIKTLVGTAGMGMTEQVEDDEALFTVPGLEEELEAERTARRASQTLGSDTVALRSGAQTATSVGTEAAKVEEEDASLFAIDSAPASPRHVATQSKPVLPPDSDITIAEVVNAVLEEEDRLFSIGDSPEDSPREASTALATEAHTVTGALTGRQPTQALQEASVALKSTVATGLAGTSKATTVAAVEDVADVPDDDSLFAIEGLEDTVRSRDMDRQVTPRSTALVGQAAGATVPSGPVEKLPAGETTNGSLSKDSAASHLSEEPAVAHGEPRPSVSPLPPALSGDPLSAVEGGVTPRQPQGSEEHGAVKDVRQDTLESVAAATTPRGAPIESAGAGTLSTPTDTLRRSTAEAGSLGAAAAVGGVVGPSAESPRTSLPTDVVSTPEDPKIATPRSMAPAALSSTGGAGTSALSTTGPLPSQQLSGAAGDAPSVKAVTGGEAGLSTGTEGAAASSPRDKESTNVDPAPTAAGVAESPRHPTPRVDSTVKAGGITAPPVKADVEVEGNVKASSPTATPPQAEKATAIPAVAPESTQVAASKVVLSSETASSDADSATVSVEVTVKAAGGGSTSAPAADVPTASNSPAEAATPKEVDTKTPVDAPAQPLMEQATVQSVLTKPLEPEMGAEASVNKGIMLDKTGSNAPPLPAERTGTEMPSTETAAASAPGVDDAKPKVGQAIELADGERRDQSPRGKDVADVVSSSTSKGPRLDTLMGRSVRVRLPAEEEGDEDEWVPAQVVSIDSGKNTVRVRYDDDPDTSEDLQIDSPDLRIEPVAQPVGGDKPVTPAPPAPVTPAGVVAASPAPVLVEAVKPAAEAATVVAAPKPAPVVPPKGDACIGWSVRVDLGDGVSELGKVMSINKANGNLLVLFPELGDEPEECGIDEVEFLHEV